MYIAGGSAACTCWQPYLVYSYLTGQATRLQSKQCDTPWAPLQGVISVTSNLIPGLFSKMMTQESPELNQELQELMAWLFCEPNPVALNTAMAMCGLIKPVFRLPYVPLNKERRQQGAKLLSKVAQHIPGCNEVRVLNDEDFTIVSNY